MATTKNPLLIICLFLLILLTLPLSGCADFENLSQGGTWGTGQSTTASRQSSPMAMPNDFAHLPPVKVAILLPLSGPQSNIGEALLNSAQLALFDIGYNNFQLMPRDTQGTTTGAAQAARSAINDGAQLIIGPLFANSVRSVKSVTKQRGINVIAFSTDWSLADSQTFMMGFMPFSQVDRIANYSFGNGYKNFALIAPKDAYGNLVAARFEALTRNNNVTIANTLRFTPGDPTVINEVAKLSGGNFQAVFMPVGGTQTETISSALSYNKMMPNNVKRIGTGLWDDARIAKQPNMQGAWFVAPSPNARRGFENKYASTYGQRPPRIATLAYDATALAATLAKNGFENGVAPAFNAAAIADQNGFAGVDGVFRFSRNGVIERQLAVLELRNGQIIEVDPAAQSF